MKLEELYKKPLIIKELDSHNVNKQHMKKILTDPVANFDKKRN